MLVEANEMLVEDRDGGIDGKERPFKFTAVFRTKIISVKPATGETHVWAFSRKITILLVET